MTTSTLRAGLQGTITLTDQITIEDPVTIDGTGVDITITCDKPGGVGHRAFVVAGTSTSVTLWAFTIYQCSPDDNGGAILNSGILTLNHMLFSNNTANTSSGGAIFNNPFASLLISVSTFQGNQASIDGGAVYNAGSLHIQDSAFSGNLAASNNNSQVGYGGAIFDGIGATILRSTFDSGRGTSGGAIFEDGEDLIIADSTLSNNYVKGIDSNDLGLGSAVFTDANSAEFYNDTIAYNQVKENTAPGAIYLDGSSVTLINTISALNTSIQDGTTAPSASCGGSSVIDSGHNLDSGSSCNFTAAGSLSNTNPGLFDTTPQVNGNVHGGQNAQSRIEQSSP
jgi:predicted outer membrane repeat protein